MSLNYEEYLQNTLHVPYVNLVNIDETTKQIITQALDEAIKRYPVLSNSLIAIGNKEYINNQLLLTYCSDKLSWLKWQKKPISDFIGDIKTSTFVITSLQREDRCYYLGLCLCPILEQLSYLDFENYKKINPNGHVAVKNSFLQPAIWHEIGHMLDFIMHISDSIAFSKLIKHHNIEQEISQYATKDKQELLAESFSMYALNAKNPLATEIGLLIDKEYLKYSKNILLKSKFDVQKYYRHI